MAQLSLSARVREGKGRSEAEKKKLDREEKKMEIDHNREKKKLVLEEKKLEIEKKKLEIEGQKKENFMKTYDMLKKLGYQESALNEMMLSTIFKSQNSLGELVENEKLILPSISDDQDQEEKYEEDTKT